MTPTQKRELFITLVRLHLSIKGSIQKLRNNAWVYYRLLKKLH